VEKRTFRLFKHGKQVRLVVISDHRWRIVRASRETGFQVGDEVSSAMAMSWEAAKRRVNSTRTAVSPNRLVLLRGKGFERTESEIKEVLRLRPWDPEAPRPA
jgi:hypothetical protein